MLLVGAMLVLQGVGVDARREAPWQRRSPESRPTLGQAPALYRRGHEGSEGSETDGHSTQPGSHQHPDTPQQLPRTLQQPDEQQQQPQQQPQQQHANPHDLYSPLHHDPHVQSAFEKHPVFSQHLGPVDQMDPHRDRAFRAQEDDPSDKVGFHAGGALYRSDSDWWYDTKHPVNEGTWHSRL